MTDIFKNRTLPSKRAIKKLGQTGTNRSSKLEKKKHKMVVQKKKVRKALPLSNSKKKVQKNSTRQRRTARQPGFSGATGLAPGHLQKKVDSNRHKAVLALLH
jgi:hypothetical protein